MSSAPAGFFAKSLSFAHGSIHPERESREKANIANEPGPFASFALFGAIRVGKPRGNETFSRSGCALPGPTHQDGLAQSTALNPFARSRLRPPFEFISRELCNCYEVFPIMILYSNAAVALPVPQ